MLTCPQSERLALPSDTEIINSLLSGFVVYTLYVKESGTAVLKEPCKYHSSQESCSAGIYRGSP